jgi:hypothetical protein
MFGPVGRSLYKTLIAFYKSRGKYLSKKLHGATLHDFIFLGWFVIPSRHIFEVHLEKDK